jgi:hypothetical protein
MTIATLAFWKATAERTVGTIAATAAALIGADNVVEHILPGVLEVDWLGILSTSLTAGILTVLKSIAATGTGNGPSLTNSETLSG